MRPVMRAWSSRGLIGALLLASCVATLACAQNKQAANGQSPGAHGGEMERRSDPLAELASLEQQMLQLGLPVASSAPRTVAPAGEGDAAAGMDGDATVGAQAESAELSEDEPPQPTPTEAAIQDAPSSKREQAQRCSDVCDLSEAICSLETQICSLSEGHGDDPTYSDACRRAGEDCDTADAECDRCAG